MKKVVLPGFLTLFTLLPVYCQNFYVKASGGYAFGIRKSTGPFPEQFSGFIFDSSSVRITDQTLGTGVNFGIAGGYIFKGGYGAEIGLSYLKGPSIPVLIYETINQNNEFVFSHTYGEAKRFNLSLLFTANFRETHSWKPYVKLGPVVPLINRIYYSSESIEPILNKLYHYYNEGVTKSRPVVGFCGAAGFSKTVYRNLAVSLEASYLSIMVSPREFQTTKIIRDGVDVTDEQTTVQKKTIYKKVLTKDSNTTEFGPKTLDSSRPYEALREFAPADHLNINLGMVYTFGNGKAVQPKFRGSL